MSSLTLTLIADSAALSADSKGSASAVLEDASDRTSLTTPDVFAPASTVREVRYGTVSVLAPTTPTDTVSVSVALPMASFGIKSAVVSAEDVGCADAGSKTLKIPVMFEKDSVGRGIA